MGWPSISFAANPNTRSAWALTISISPPGSIITIAFGADSTTCRKRSSSRLREEMSTIADSTIVPSSVSIGFRPISTGNSLPSFFRPYRSRPAPIGRDCGSWKNEPRRSGWLRAKPLRHQHLDRLAEHLARG